jgi:hypothetical protein
MIPGWEHLCRVLNDLGIEVAITSNFARRYSAQEIEALVRMDLVTISVDTADRELLRHLRRHADLRTILHNMLMARLQSLPTGALRPVRSTSSPRGITTQERLLQQLLETKQVGSLHGRSSLRIRQLINRRRAPLPGRSPWPRRLSVNQGCFSFLAARLPCVMASCSHM